uniref:Uncharacterized protein n=1 Tax=Tetranychus urticae TaxID=32264 RepID=T1L5V7_TETUR
MLYKSRLYSDQGMQQEIAADMLRLTDKENKLADIVINNGLICGYRHLTYDEYCAAFFAEPHNSTDHECLRFERYNRLETTMIALQDFVSSLSMTQKLASKRSINIIVHKKLAGKHWDVAHILTMLWFGLMGWRTNPRVPAHLNNISRRISNTDTWDRSHQYYQSTWKNLDSFGPFWKSTPCIGFHYICEMNVLKIMEKKMALFELELAYQNLTDDKKDLKYVSREMIKSPIYSNVDYKSFFKSRKKKEKKSTASAKENCAIPCFFLLLSSMQFALLAGGLRMALTADLYFKIRRGINECGIEDKIYFGTPDFSRP